jgi:hypothetical protein
MIRRLPFIAAAGLLLSAGPAAAVGLGPLTAEGLVDGPKKAFYLTLLNPYPTVTDFVAYATGLTDDDAGDKARVTLFPDQARLGSGRSRRLLVIVGGLSVGETYSFRVCAQRRTPPEGITIHARVCSKLTARRVA